ncbi:unnamed protein product [Cuscuta epithymum]|uniref:Uncharacterized protein n=1 Tax=Cuscuta epithymum TaxID=186058 RepID=A0AAV0DAD5_9ASTE|nr:unnamed protein product [Cuscuta epithymum]
MCNKRKSPNVCLQSQFGQPHHYSLLHIAESQKQQHAVFQALQSEHWLQISNLNRSRYNLFNAKPQSLHPALRPIHRTLSKEGNSFKSLLRGMKSPEEQLEKILSPTMLL